MAKDRSGPSERDEAKQAGGAPVQGDVPGVRGAAPSPDLGGEPADSGTIGDEGGAGAHPGGPTFSERTYPTTHPPPGRRERG